MRATTEQERLLRRAAEVSRKTLTEFITDSAFRAAEETLPGQRLFLVDNERYQRLLEILEQPLGETAASGICLQGKSRWDEK